MKIIDIEALIPQAPARRSWLVAERMASPMSAYPEYAETRSAWQGMVPRTIARVTTDEGSKVSAWAAAARPVVTSSSIT